MSLSNDIMTTMPVAPAGQTGSTCNGWGNDSAWWIIILFLFVFCGGWGNRGAGGNGGGDSGYATTAGFDNVYRKLDGVNNGLCEGFYGMNTSTLNGFAGVNQNVSGASAGVTQNLTAGFSGLNQSINNGIYGVTQAVNTSSADTNQTLNTGFSGLNQTINNGFSQAELSNCNRTANITQQLNNMAMNQQNCCCETRESIQGVNYNLATQSCGIQNAINNSTRDVIDNANANSRAILDYLCNDKISTLQSENQALRLAASQQAQNATLQGMMTANTNQIISRVAPYPIPAYQVPNPYCGCGCGCA